MNALAGWVKAMRNAEDGQDHAGLELDDPEVGLNGDGGTGGDFEEEVAGRAGGSLLDASEKARFRSRWDSVQAGFVDDPRRAVEQADIAVDAVVQRIGEALTEERDRLARSWDGGSAQPNTEDLRLTMHEYRSFLEKLLAH